MLSAQGDGEVADLVVIPKRCAARHSSTATKGPRLLVAGEGTGRIGGHVPVEAHVGLRSVESIGRHAPFPASLGGEGQAYSFELGHSRSRYRPV